MTRASVCRSFVMLALLAAAGMAHAQQTHVAEAARGERSNPADVVFNRLVTVRLDGVSVRDAVDAIAASAKIKVQYRRELLQSASAPVTLHADKLPLGTALGRVLEGTGLQAVALDADLIGVTSAAPASAAMTGPIMGRVTSSSTGKPIANVILMVDDSVRGARTDADGRFVIAAVSAGRHRVTTRALGFTKQAHVVTVKDGETTTLDLVLTPSVNALDQVVVTGTVAATERRAISNTMTVIDAKELEQRNITRIDQLFRGDIPGLFTPQTGTSATTLQGGNFKYGAVRMYSRGSTALPTSFNDGSGDAPTNSPGIKTYVDGVLMSDPDYVNQIDPKSIDRIEVITGPQASTLYGSDALGGVMQIFTKRGRPGQRPEVTASLQYGTIENNFTSSLAPRHNDNLQVTDVIGPLSYNLGGTYSFDGQWTPGMYTRTWGGYGAGRRAAGPLTVDLTARYNQTRIGGASANGAGSLAQVWQQGMADGTYAYERDVVLPQPNAQYNIVQTTYGTTLAYTPQPWFRNTLTIGLDNSSNGSTTQGARYTRYNDSSNTTRTINATRTVSGSFNSTLDNDLGPLFHSTLTAGMDLRRTAVQRVNEEGNDISHLTSGFDNRTRDKSRGYFGQWLLGMQNTLYLTLALRAEENPNYGADHRFDYAPRYGLSAVRDFGDLTVKARYTDGRSTRPPASGSRNQINACDDPTSFNCTYYTPTYGDGLVVQRGNPELQPESQRGPEYGIDLYLGSQLSLSVTGYRQKVINLINSINVDSVAAIDPSNPYYYYTTGYVNVGDIKNDGIMTEATFTEGVLTFHGTYSWNKSRIVRISPSYSGPAGVGDSFQSNAEHSGAITGTYATARTTLSATVNYVGQILAARPVNGGVAAGGNIRVGAAYLPNAFNFALLTPLSPSAQLALNGSRMINRNMTLFFSVMNATNYYRNEGAFNNVRNPVIGRQSTIGVRLRH